MNTRTPTDRSQKLQLAQRTLDQLLEWGARIDGKSSLVLGVTTGMIGVLAGLAPAGSWSPALFWSAGLTLLVLGLALLCMYLGTYPRTREPGRSLFFFGSIARRDWPDYRDAFLDLSPQDELEDLLALCHRNAAILSHKFLHLQRAYRLMFAGVAPWALALYHCKLL